MNGEVNGTMQEPMDTSLPGPLINQKIHTSADVKSAPKHNEESNSSVDRSPLESEANQDPFNRDMDTSEILASIEMEDQNSNDSNISNPGKPTSNQSLGNCSEPTNDHCSLSNESDPESMTSSKARLETTDHQIMQNMDEKHKDNNLKSYVNSNEAVSSLSNYIPSMYENPFKMINSNNIFSKHTYNILNLLHVGLHYMII